jgi:hypothetical protein
MSKARIPIIGLISRFAPIHGAHNPVMAADAQQRVVTFLREHL